MSQVDFSQGGLTISQITAAAASSNVTLLAPLTGKRHRIKWICCYATAATAADVKITQGDGTTIMARFGGVGTGLLNQPLYFGGGPNPSQNEGLVCKVNDQTIVTLSTTSGTNTDLSVAYDFV